jgi:hypothetical protein
LLAKTLQFLSASLVKIYTTLITQVLFLTPDISALVFNLIYTQKETPSLLLRQQTLF